MTEYTAAAVAVLVPRIEIVRGDNDRTRFDQAALEELAKSIAADGLDQPITVRPVAPRLVEDDQGERTALYEIVAGERRFIACGLAGLTHVPAIIRDLSDEQAARLMFHENIKRVDLDAIEEAGVYQKWYAKLGWTLARIAEEAGKTRGHVEKRLALLKLIPDVQKLVRSGALRLSYAEAMVSPKEGESLNEWSQAQAVKLLGSAQRHPAIGEWRRMVGELLAAQSQVDMFDFDGWGEAFEKGQKKARVSGLARDPRLPRLVANDTTGRVLRRYVEELKAAGLGDAALIVSTVLDDLYVGNLVQL